MSCLTPDATLFLKQLGGDVKAPSVAMQIVFDILSVPAVKDFTGLGKQKTPLAHLMVRGTGCKLASWPQIIQKTIATL